MEVCKLCCNNTVLIRKSHIISDFLYSKLYDKSHKLNKFSVTELKKEKPRILKPSSGTYEGNLLCYDCESKILSGYEGYFSKAIRRGHHPPITLKRENLNGVKLVHIMNMDYKQTKLFLLSLLWRANISTRKEYEEVKLGPYSENIRKQLLFGEPSNDIDISIYRFEKGSGFNSFIGQPRRHKIGHSTSYSIIINGYMIVYHLKPNIISKPTMKYNLNADNSLTLVEIPKNKIESFLLEYTGLK